MSQIKTILGSVLYYVLSYFIVMVILAFILTTITECASSGLSIWRVGADNLSPRAHCGWLLLLCACYLGTKFIWKIFTWGRREDVVAGA